MAPDFPSLPSELLLLILEYIHTLPNATPSLASLCLTSQRIRSLAEPFLYASYSNANQIDKPHIFPLSLISRPDLADHVREINIRVEGGVNPMPEDTFRHLRKAIDELDVPESLLDYWKKLLASIGIFRAAACAELSLLLASRKVQNISLQLSSLHEFSLISHILFETPNWPGRFDQVHSVSVVSLPGTFDLHLYSLAYMFSMPSLRRFEITGCHERSLGRSLGWNSKGDLQMDLGWWRRVQDSGVESIIIRKGGVPHYAVNVLLNCCKALKCLHVEVDLPWSEWALFQFFRLEDALCRHAKSLEYLAISQDQDNRKRQEEPGFRHSGILSFLPKLCKLKSAVAPLRALTAIPEVGSIEIVHSEDGSTGEFFDDAEIRKYLPPFPGKISICNEEVHYGATTHLLELA
ncbi:uncharacterized protein CC84DRAFT_1165021 [Paraphaeosphaeria sporulosa]|uniref:Uncharacterized protein n=1 Tax=Paraphaeosphaeria sporulosa TaxID=1460663 RepID=A0A177CBM0_9PLEO|nr:uncharacterized protein CC84DRAFT_1165021 [Paraphaeosphaeria sporulosa]OAG04591.1 hypothetical protein CC84DRAFT_1165021 [Paraphaeosphaeria sporulosa]